MPPRLMLALLLAARACACPRGMRRGTGDECGASDNGPLPEATSASRMAHAAARWLEDRDDMVYDGQDREAIAPRYGRLLCCNDPVRKSAVSVAKDTGLTTPEKSRSRGPGRDAAATAAA